ncbi:unnamed protein product [Blepharisma stoltei]|uniref:Ribosomal protein S4 n=1 Tax=Blepharisma stoltei TaxID=1481888 RepID=A0AAU9JJ98_9CILI|nr:unnamed protein product [Blepharisma stoltei]
MNDLNIATKREWIITQYKHKQRLKEIKSNPSKSVGSSSSPQQILHRKKKKRCSPSNLSFCSSHQTENYKLLNQLIEITSFNKQSAKQEHHSARSHSIRMPAMEREQRRIKDENLKLAQRLIGIRPYFSISEWEKAFKESRKYRKILNKDNVLLNGKISHERVRSVSRGENRSIFENSENSRCITALPQSRANEVQKRFN